MKIKDIVLRLKKKEVFDNIMHLFKAFLVDSDVEIAIHKIKNKQDAIYFIVDTEQSSYNILKLCSDLQEIIGGDISDAEANIFIRNKKILEAGFIEETFRDTIQFSQKNFKNVQDFLEKNYQQYFESVQDKRYESFSIRRRSMPLFEDENAKSIKQEGSPSLLAQEIVTQLKLNQTLWNDILASSELATIFKKLDEEISQELKKINDIIRSKI